MAARLIHKCGPRAKGPFVPVDCGGLSATLIESELFGHVRGAFTGAVQNRNGLFQAAQGGTIFLDEIAELPLDLQVKLLRALQEKEVRPVGGTSALKVDFRVIAATNQDLDASVRKGEFRADLYFRLQVVTLRMPSLRERKEDIPLLATHFLEKHKAPGGSGHSFSEAAIRSLLAHDWPGNVRELEHRIERALALSSGPIIDAADLDIDRSNGRRVSMPESGEVIPLRQLEKAAILNCLKIAGADKQLAAAMLGIGITTLYRKLKQYRDSPHEGAKSAQS